MAVNVGTIEGLLKLRDEFTGVLGNAAQSLAAAGKKAEEVGRKMETVGTQLTVGITAPLAAIGGVALTSFGQFDDALNSSIAIMGDVSDALRDDMAVAAIEVSEDVRASATQAAESFFFLASAGLDAVASIAALPTVAAFGQAGMFDMARATDLLTDAQSALGLAIRDDAVANMENMVRVSDVLVKANTLANASVEQFSLALTSKAATAMKDLGIEIEAGVAVLAAWADQGIKAQQAGERFNIVTRDLQTAYRNNTEEFRKWNIEVFDAAGNFRSMADIIGDMERALGPMSTEQRGATLALLGFTDRSIVATKSLIGLSSNIRDYEIQLRAAAGTTQEVADKQMQSFVAQMGLLKDRIVNVGIALGAALMPAVNAFIPVVNAAVDLIKGWVEAFGELPEGLRVVVVALAAMAAAAGPVLLLAGKLTVAYGTLLATFPAVAGAITAVVTVLTGPAGLVAAAAAVLLTLKPVREFLVRLASQVFVTVHKSVEVIVAKLKLWWKATEDGRKLLVAFGKVVARDVVKTLGVLVGWLVKAAKEVAKAMVAFVKWTKVIPAVKLAVDANVKALKGLWEWLVKTSNKILQWVEALGGVESILAVINPALAISIGKLKDWAAEAEDSVRFTDAMDQAMADMAATMPEVSEGLDEATAAVEETTAAIVTSTTAITTWGSSTDDIIIIADRVDTAFNALGDAASNMSDQVRNSRDGYDLLKRTFDTWGLSALEVVDLTRDLGTAQFDGTITMEQYRAAMERIENRSRLVSASQVELAARFSSVATSVGDAFISMAADGQGFLETLEGLRTTTLESITTDFASGFAEVFGQAMASGTGAAGSVREAWGSASKGMKVSAVAAGVALVAMATGANEIVALAASAIASFVSGDWASAIIAVVEIVSAGGPKSLGAATKSLEKYIATLKRGRDMTFSFRQATNDMLRIIGQLTGTQSQRALAALEDNFQDLINAAVLMGDQGVEAVERMVLAINSADGRFFDAEGFEIQADVIIAAIRNTTDQALAALEERNNFIQDQTADLIAGLSQMFADMGELTVNEIQFAATSVIQAFDAMIAGGVSLADALAQIGEVFGQIGERGAELGLDLGVEFARLGEIMNILADEGIQNVIGRLEGMGAAANAAGNLGLLTAQQFDALDNQLTNTFDRLINSGLSSEEALAALAPQLQILNDLSEQYGFVLDDNTQSLLDQAIAQGLVTEKGLTSEDILIKGFDRLIIALNRIIEALGGVGVAFGDWTDAANEGIGSVSGNLSNLSDEFDEFGNSVAQFAEETSDFFQGTGDFGIPRPPPTPPIAPPGDPGNPPGGGGDTAPPPAPPPPPPPPPGGPGDPDNPPGGFAEGSGGFRDFGLSTSANLHGTEQVLTAREGGDIASMVLAAVQQATQAPTGLAEILEGGFAAMVDAQMETAAAQGDMAVTLGSLTDRIAQIEARGNTR